MATMKKATTWHNKVIEKLKEKLRKQQGIRLLKGEEAVLKISHPKNAEIEKPIRYEPDIIFEKDGQRVIIEVETRFSAKIVEDLVYSSIVKEKVNCLIIIFSDRNGKAEKRKDHAKSRITRAKLLCKNLKCHLRRMPKVKVKCVKNEKDIEKIKDICLRLLS